jgi:zinc transporter, ZIP family
MWIAALWGVLTALPLFIGAILALYISIPKKIVGLIMAFGTGALIGAASFELLIDAVKGGGLVVTTTAFIIGAIVFTLGDFAVIKHGGKERKRSKESKENSSGIAIFFGTLLDAIPESFIIGALITSNNGISYPLIGSIIISNFPEGLSSSIGLKKSSYKNKQIIFLWSFVILLTGFCSFLGYIVMQNMSPLIFAGLRSFAAGAILAMVASTMLPEAYEEGGPSIGFFAALGLITALIFTKL